jgi:murein DD-endopeptidase MepM/ murein hydrolase activator NlpD
MTNITLLSQIKKKQPHFSSKRRKILALHSEKSTKTQYRMRRPVLFVIKILMALPVFSQSIPENEHFIPPVNIPIYLSGNFAELRSDHFHSGIDIKTQGVIGKPVFTIDDGYVSRIKVQTNGYGKSVYINHPGGYTSVYGHLDEYNTEIASYVKKYQYKNQIHTLDIYPGRNELPVKKGEMIARAGNTGSSSGPHLHFEIRNTGNQHPLNVQKFGFNIPDNVDPRIFNFYIYSFSGKDDRRIVQSRRKAGLKLNDKSYSLKAGDTLLVNSPVSFGMEVYDFLNGTHNKCGVYFIKTFVDGDLVYHFQTDEFSFAESRYINAHTDYSLKKSGKENVHRLFRLPNNRLSMYPELINDGIISVTEDQVKRVKILFADIDGNQRSVDFFIKRNPVQNQSSLHSSTEGELFQWDRINTISDEMISLEIPARSLYEDVWLKYEVIPSENKTHPRIYKIHNEEVPLHLPAKLTFKNPGIETHLLKYACIVRYDEKGIPIYEGGNLKDDNRIETLTRSFGTFGVELDSVPPVIVPLNFNRNANLHGKKDLRLTIRDNLSGIKSYKAYIDSKWVLFEYDPKNDLIFHQFDPEVIEKGKKHELEIYVEDERGNIALFHSAFTW